MKIANYKDDLLGNDIPRFTAALKRMKTENITYSEIKRLNKFLKDYIENIDDEELIERNEYRIVPHKYSLVYLFSLYLQRSVDVAEYRVAELKNARCYSSFKRERKSEDCKLEDKFNKEVIGTMLLILSNYKGLDVPDTHGFKNTFEIKETLDKSHIHTALKNLGRMVDREIQFKSKNAKSNNNRSKDELEALAYEHIKGYAQSIYDFVNSKNMLNKVSIIHIPLFNDSVPSMYIAEINTILVSQCFNTDTIERRLLSEFGMYMHYCITKDVTKTPGSFAEKHTDLTGMLLNNLYFDLFAYKMMKDTALEEKDAFANSLKFNSEALSHMDRDAKYFDILLE